MGVIISGNKEKIQTQLSLICTALEQQCINLDKCEWDISIKINGHPQVLIDRSSLLPIERCASPFIELKESYFIDNEIYSALMGNPIPLVLGKPNTKSIKKVEENTSHQPPIHPFTKTEGEFAKKEASSPKTAPPIPQATLSYFESDFILRDENQLCAYAIKEINDGLYSFYFRSSIYDRGSDTTFRHYIDRRKGNLIVYRYFKSIGSIKMVFGDIGKPLRYNGNNLLSDSDVLYIESQFSKHRFL